jgi:small nuclear ribonucleoprotein (snRNP)-like protein
MTVSELKPFEDREVVLNLKGGETLRAKVLFVDFEYEDIIVDVLETNQPENYKDPNACYTVDASDIVTATSST